MTTRLKFALIAGLVGLVLGVITAWFVWRQGESFPAYIIIPFLVLFSFCGFFMKKDWIYEVLEFFTRVW